MFLLYYSFYIPRVPFFGVPVLAHLEQELNLCCRAAEEVAAQPAQRQARGAWGVSPRNEERAVRPSKALQKGSFFWVQLWNLPVGSYHVPFLGYLILVLGIYNHKVGYRNKGVWYEPTGIRQVIGPISGPTNRTYFGLVGATGKDFILISGRGILWGEGRLWPKPVRKRS